MEHLHRSRYLRWTVLIVVLANSFFNVLYKALNLPGGTVKEVSDSYKTLFTPAGYAFAIWGVIYLSFIIYAIYQLLPAQRMARFYDRMAWPVIAANLLCMVWQVAFRNYIIGGSVVIILATLCVAIIMQVKVRKEAHNYFTWLTVPFSLFLGWICVATIANVASWLVATGWQGGAWSASAWAIIMVLTAGVISFILGRAYRDFIIPVVIAWALAAIYAEVLHVDMQVATTSLVMGIVAAIWALGVFLFYRKKRSLVTGI